MMMRRWNPWWAPTTDASQIRAGERRDALGELLRMIQRPFARYRIIALLGIRQCGKSTLMRQLVRELLVLRELAPAEVVLINFEDPVFLGASMDADLLQRAFDVFQAHMEPRRIPLVCLDEVERIEGWASWVRMMHETEQARCIITGSSSRLLEAEVGRLLTGRCDQRTVWPLSFAEFLRFRGYVPDRVLDGDELTEEQVQAQLLAYLEQGGMPRAVLEQDELERHRLLSQYLYDIIHRDVVVRHSLRTPSRVEVLAKHLLTHSGSEFTFNRLRKLYQLTPDQTRTLVGYLEEAYLVRALYRFSHKPVMRERSPRKGFAADTGLRNTATVRLSPDNGHLAETVVHNTLLRRYADRGGEVFYFNEKREADFVVREGLATREVIEVTYQDDPLPQEKVGNLLAALDSFSATVPGLLLTRGTHRDQRVGERLVRIRPLWRWLLDEGSPSDAD